MRYACHEAEFAVLRDCADRARHGAQPAVDARIAFQRLVVSIHFGVDQHRVEVDVAAEPGVYHISVQPHVSQPGLDGDQLVAYVPDSAGPSGHVHWKPRRRRYPSDAEGVQSRYYPLRDGAQIAVNGAILLVHDRERSAPYGVAVCLLDDGNERFGLGVGSQGVLPLLGQLLAVDLDETGGGSDAVARLAVSSFSAMWLLVVLLVICALLTFEKSVYARIVPKK